MSSRPVGPARSANIFINYRRDDSAGHAGRLFDSLSSHFPGRLFMDVDTIAPGVDFGDAIEQAVGACEVLIVVIGREWLTMKNAAGQRRLDDHGDFVRMEVEAALVRNIRVIPVLVEDAPMPRTEDLPPSLAKLARRNAIELSDARWNYDVERLAQTIRGVLGEEKTSAPPPQEPQALPIRLPENKPAGLWTWRRAVMLLLVALILGAAGWLSKNQLQSAAGEPADSRVSSMPDPASPTPVPASSNPTPVPTPSSPTLVPASSNLAPEKQTADVKPAESEPSDEASQLPAVTITSPKDGAKVGKCFQSTGVISGLGTGQRAFLSMKNREGTIYPRTELSEGQWSLEASSSHRDFEVFVLISTNQEAGEALGDRGNQEHGLRLLPKGAFITGPVISMNRLGKVVTWIKSECGKKKG